MVAGSRGDVRGFSLIEAAAAMAVVCILLAGVAPLVVQALRSAEAVRTRTMTAMLASARMEQLLALPWAVVETAGGGVEAYSDYSSNLSPAMPSAGGPGLAATPDSTLLSNADGHADFLDARGQWVGDGTDYPPTAAYVRRWTVAPLGSDADTLVLRVLVSPATADRLAQPRSGTPLPGDTWLTSVRTRVRQ